METKTLRNQIQKTLLKKGVILSIMGSVVLVGGGGLWYTIHGYGAEQKQANTTITKTELPNGTFVNVTVNNILSGAQVAKSLESVESIESQGVIAPKIAVTPITQSVQQLATQTLAPQPTIQDEKPHMLVVSDSVDIADNTTNAISGTNTTIGTGEIKGKLRAQKSPYIIFAGTFLPATMVTPLNSDNSGEIVATVRNNVYDSTTGKYLLIPQGSRLIGTYNHNIAYGQNRLVAGWNRVIYPNGTDFPLRGQPGTDLSGASGFSGDVDNHWMQKFGTSALMGLIFGGMTMATGNQATNPYQLSAGATIASQVGAQMSQAGLQVIQKGVNIPPTIIISEGYKFNILTTADLVLKPYVYTQRTEMR